jgi:hypothetical protein
MKQVLLLAISALSVAGSVVFDKAYADIHRISSGAKLSSSCAYQGDGPPIDELSISE